MKDEISLIRDARPKVSPPPARFINAERNRLLDYIRDHQALAVEIPDRKSRRRRSWVVPVASMVVLATTAAAWGALQNGGNLDSPPFSGADWELIVGEEANGDGTFKVCHRFQPPDEPHTENNALGTGGCTTSPNVDGNGVIVDVRPAFETATGIVLFVDLSEERVARLVITPDVGRATEVAPFAMPRSGKQVAALELPGQPSSVRVEALDDHGRVLDTHSVTDLNTR